MIAAITLGAFISYVAFDLKEFTLTENQAIWLIFSFCLGSLYYHYFDRIKLNNYYLLTGLAIIWIISFKTFLLPITTVVFIGYLTFSFAYSKILFKNFLDKIGDISYGTYIVAFPIQQTFIFLFPEANWLILFVCCMPVIILLAYLSWHIIEKNALKLKPKKKMKPE